MKTKVCSKCGVEYPATTKYFRKDKAGKDGLRANCKTCEALYQQENKERIAEYRKQYRQENKEYVAESDKQYRKENKEHIAERAKQYHKDNKEYRLEYHKQHYQENKERIAEHHNQHYQDNKEHLLEYHKRYRQDNKEYISERQKKYQQENPEKHAIKSQRRRAREKEFDSTLTLEQWKKIKENFNHKCAYCGKEKKLQQEHYLPLSKGGEYTHNNIVPACGSCNSSKGAKLFHEWYPKQKHYSKAREKHLLQYLGYIGERQQLSIL